MNNHNGIHPSALPVSHPSAPGHPLCVANIDDSLTAAHRSNITVHTNLLPALGITAGPNTHSKSVHPLSLTRPCEPTTFPRTITLNGDRPDVLAKPPAKKRQAI